MRQTHMAGDKLFVDYAGQTVPVVDADTGEIRQAQVFVAVLGASNYTYACATASQKAADWVACIMGALEFIGGVPRLLVPDQPRALMTRADRYEPTAYRLLDELCAHYGVAVMPARPAKPRDKPKVEVAVQVVERWILARLRHQTFFSLAELNRSIAGLLVDLNQRPFKKLPGNRASAFAELDGHYYSVPHALVGEVVELRITATTVEVLHGHKRVAAHALNGRKGAHTTAAEHMPASHRAHLQWTPAKLIAWGERIGSATAAVVRWQMEHRAHPEQGYRACLGLMRLGRQYGAERLEAACARAQSIRSRTCAGRATTTETVPRPKEHPMLNGQTLNQLRALRLDGMVADLSDAATHIAASELPFEQRLALLVQREVDWRVRWGSRRHAWGSPSSTPGLPDSWKNFTWPMATAALASAWRNWPGWTCSS